MKPKPMGGARFTGSAGSDQQTPPWPQNDEERSVRLAAWSRAFPRPACRRSGGVAERWPTAGSHEDDFALASRPKEAGQVLETTRAAQMEALAIGDAEFDEYVEFSRCLDPFR